MSPAELEVLALREMIDALWSKTFPGVEIRYSPMGWDARTPERMVAGLPSCRDALVNVGALS